MKIRFLMLFLIQGSLVHAKPLEPITFDGNNGAKVTGDPKWDSTQLSGKAHVMFYVDPDEKDTNQHVADALKAEDFDKTALGSVAIINMAATWIPNFAIANMLKSKQEEFPDTLYIKDFKKHLVKKWELKDDSSCILLVNHEVQLLRKQCGKHSKDDIKDLISKIRLAVKNLPAVTKVR